jgi:ATPase subunit of ABC transporter with duplicated ATPase domains
VALLQRAPGCCSPSPPPRLLLLDERTNNLDLDSVERLTEALAGFRGTLVVASHDHPFLRKVGCTRWWSVDGGLREVAEPGHGRSPVEAATRRMDYVR